MSNRIDFYQPIQDEMTIPVGRLAVFLEGQLCPFLETIEIVRAPFPEFGYAKFKYNMAGYDGLEIVDGERFETIVGMGKSITVCRLYDGGTGDVEAESVAVFDGQVEQIDRTIDGNGEVIEITARDFGAVLERITVYGSRIATGAGESLFVDGIEAVFNKDSQGNASSQLVSYEGKSCRVFAAEEVIERPWTCAEATIYLLSEYLPLGSLQVPDLAQIEAVTNNCVINETDVEGFDLAKALGKCCEDAGVDYKIVSRSEIVGPRQSIVFYKPSLGREVELNRQFDGDTLSISRTNVWRLKSKKNLWPVTHRFIGLGDFKIFEATFDLVKAWDPGLEGGQQSDYSPSTNSAFESVRDVYRKWCLNEAGNYSIAPYNQGDAFDFSFIFETSRYLPKKRRFIETISTDSAGQSHGCYLEVSYDNGSTWQQYIDSFDILADECGIWLSVDEFDGTFWAAVTGDTLRFRITAAVQSDRRLKRQVANGPVDSACEVVDHVATNSSEFKFSKISGKSIFYAQDSKDNIDDGDALMGQMRWLAENDHDVIETSDIEMPISMLDYHVGDKVVSNPESRDIAGIRTDSRSVFHIERVKINFSDQCTEMKVSRRRY
ncbi:MAG TPA: hypothetical protein ENH94_07435 [Phycisphaerales bacterium]|nr:hypothetical protein [Phycisphaerales bacterium]